MARFRSLSFWSRFLAAALGMSLLASCIAPGGDEGSDEIAQQPITGTGHGLVASFSNSRNRCSFRRQNTSSQFDLKCQIVVAVGGNEFAAQSKAKDVHFEWQKPVPVDDADISVHSCEVQRSGLSQDCVVSVHNPLGNNKVRVDVDVQRKDPRSGAVVETRTESRTVLLAYGAFTQGLIPHVPLSFRPNPKEVGLLDGILDIFGLSEKKVAEVGYQTQRFDPLKFKFEGITSTCAGAEGLYFATPHYVFLRDAKTNQVQIFAGNSNLDNVFRLEEELEELAFDRDQRDRIWEYLYPGDSPRYANPPIRQTIIDRLSAYRRHRLQLAFGKRIRLACHPGKPGLVYLLESFDAVKDGEAPNVNYGETYEELSLTTRHRLWKVDGDQLSLVVLDWGMEEVEDWHPRLSPSNGLHQTTLAPPREATPTLALGARFEGVHDIASDSNGTLYLADALDHRIRRIRNGLVDVFAGKGLYGCRDSGSGGCGHLPEIGQTYALTPSTPPKEAILVYPMGLGIGLKDEVLVTTPKGVFQISEDSVKKIHTMRAADVTVVKDGRVLVSSWTAPEAILQLEPETQGRTVLMTSAILPHSLSPFEDTVAFARSYRRDASPGYPHYVDDGGRMPDNTNFYYQRDISLFFPQELMRGEVARMAINGGGHYEAPLAGAPPEARLYPLYGMSIPTENLQLPEMVDMEMDKNGNLFFIGENTGAVFVIETTTEGRQVRHIVGLGDETAGAGCEDPNLTPTQFMGPRTTRLSDPRGLGLDRFGNLYIADTGNNRILKYTPDDKLFQVAGLGCASKTTNPYLRGTGSKMPRYSPNSGTRMGPGTGVCVQALYECSHMAGEASVCTEENVPECGPIDYDPDLACRQDAHLWHPTEVAVWDRHLFILMVERNAVLRMDLSEPNPVPQMALNDPWGARKAVRIATLTHEAQKSNSNVDRRELEYYTSLHCPKLGPFGQISDIAVDSEENLYAVDYKRPHEMARIPSADLSNLRYAAYPRADVEQVYVSNNGYWLPITNADSTIQERHPVAIAPNPNGGLYAVYSKSSEEELNGVMHDGNHDSELDLSRHYFFPVQGGEALVNLEPNAAGYKAHVLADQEKTGNKDCGSGVISGEAKQEDLQSSLKASIATLCRSFSRAIASYPQCTNGGETSGFALPQSFSNATIFGGFQWGKDAPELNREQAAPAANILTVQTPCLTN